MDEEVDSETGLSDTHLIALGELAIWSARLSQTLEDLQEALFVSSAEASRTRLVRGGFSAVRRQVLELLPNDAIARQIPWLHSRVASTEAAMERRNELLHGYWFGRLTERAPDRAAIDVKRRAGIARRESVSVDDIRAVSRDIARTEGDLWLMAAVVRGSIGYVTNGIRLERD